MVFSYPSHLVSFREIQYNIVCYIMNLHGIIKKIEATHLRDNVADVRVGETVRVHYKIREGNKERVQVFEGLVIATKAGLSLQGSFTVRKVADGVGVERTFPLHSPWMVKIERLKSGKARRAKLNFVRKHAMSSRFKLKDKGIVGTIWEEVAKEKAEIEQGNPEQQESAEVADEKPEVEETAQTADNTGDAPTQNPGQPSGEPGSELPETTGSDDPVAESKN